MNSELEFSTQAYCKIVMHVMKHCHTTCTGLLLSPNPKNNHNDDEPSNKLIITEAIPLFHGLPYLTPNFEIALNTVAVYAKHQQLCISGYYQANRSQDNNEPDIFSQRITEKIRETSNDAVLCMINNAGFETMQAHMILRPYQLIDGRWKLKPANTYTVEGGDNDRMNKEILFSKDKLYRAIVDFDDHLDDISLDWTNARVTQKIDYLCARIC